MIKTDRLKAIDFYRKAAEMNHPGAMLKYAQILEKGIHVRANNKSSFILFCTKRLPMKETLKLCSIMQ